MRAPFTRTYVLVKQPNGKYRVKLGWRRTPTPAKVSDWLTGNVVPVRKVPRAIRAYYRDTLHRAAEAARAYGKPIHVNSSYRDPKLQAEMYAQNMLNGQPRPGHPLTARPGTSPHERGIGLDIPDARITPGLIDELHKRQMIDDVPSEKWHITNHAALRLGA